jgi:hypothetical protein
VGGLGRAADSHTLATASKVVVFIVVGDRSGGFRDELLTPALALLIIVVSPGQPSQWGRDDVPDGAKDRRVGAGHPRGG